MKAGRFGASCFLLLKAVSFVGCLALVLGDVGFQALQDGGFRKDGRRVDAPDPTHWSPAPRGRFGALATVQGPLGEPRCQGIFINKFFVLTAAACVERTGVSPVVVVGYDTANGGNLPEDFEARHITQVTLHPKRSGAGYDVALLRLAQPFEGPIPIPAQPTRTPIVQEPLVGFSQAAGLQKGQFRVVKAGVCPVLLGRGFQGDCVYSEFAVVETDFVGSPLIRPDEPPKVDNYEDMIRSGKPAMDVLVAIVTHVPDALLKENGTYAVGCTHLGDLHSWIKDTVGPTATPGFFLYGMLLTAAALLVAYFGTRMDVEKSLLAFAAYLRCRPILGLISAQSARRHEICTPNDGKHSVLILFVKEIGKGAMGVVYKVQLWGMGSRWLQVAVKVSFESGSEAGSMQKEYNIFKSTQEHPNVLRCYGFGRLRNGREFVVTELMDNSLEDLIKAQGSSEIVPALTYLAVLEIFQWIARGMLHLRTRGVVHFDLKPSNVLVNVTYDGAVCSVKVGDFDSSEMRSRTMCTGKFRGTFWYMAPELRFLNNERPGEKTMVNREKVDVFSFGRLMRRCVVDPSSNMCEIQGLEDLIGECESWRSADRPCWEQVLATLSGLIDGRPPWVMQTIPPGI